MISFPVVVLRSDASDDRCSLSLLARFPLTIRRTAMTRSPFYQSSVPDTLEDLVITHETIASRARELWLEQGCPKNHDNGIWLEAEAELHAIQQGRFRHPQLQSAD